ncbi:hypothetical protein SESBI_37981 [Sesbania bispinosa]|nr:hypothetical protein SESBI_37981 [Sesbania bispinosa]
MYTKSFDHSIKDEQAKISSESETTDGSLSSENSISEVVDGVGSSSGSERQIDVITIGVSNFSDKHINGTKSISASARRSSSSSSSESSSDDFFGMGALKFTTSDASALESKSRKDYVSSSESSAKSEVNNSPPVPTSTFPVFNVTHSQKGMSPTISPPIQVMDRSGGYDSSRISSSVFERSTNQLEWSFPSNDSLFSIQIGQNSFSRENALMFGELGLSEELTKSGELKTLNRTPSNVVEKIDKSRKKTVVIEDLKTREISEEAFKLEQEHSEDQNDIKTLHQAGSCKSSKSNASSLSHESATNAHSFVPLSIWSLSSKCERSVHGHFATVVIVAGCSATINGQTAAVRGQAVSVHIAAGRSAAI